MRRRPRWWWIVGAWVALMLTAMGLTSLRGSGGPSGPEEGTDCPAVAASGPLPSLSPSRMAVHYDTTLSAGECAGD
ncbi:hypothetical protein ABZ930_13440 [Streptomyces sp. NPDC046716]|uniref:hypothetical protein n=1 Tax=Streptomyces sp. NPDC046716 TaxID=3157093 RepID=UPI0033C6051F